MNWYIEVLKKYAVFQGRASRSEYWYFILFNFLISIGTSFIDMAAGTYDYETGSGIINMVYSLAVLIPSIAVACRRMHDVGKSGWFMLIPFYNLYLACLESEPFTNQYGPNPWGEGEDEDISEHLVDNN